MTSSQHIPIKLARSLTNQIKIKVHVLTKKRKILGWFSKIEGMLLILN